MKRWAGVVDRAAVRRFVDDEFRELKAAGATGRNVHQFALDQHDAMMAMVQELSETDQELFLSLYQQESAAAHHAAMDESRRDAARAVERSEYYAQQDAIKERQNSVAAIIIGIVVALLVYMFWLRS